MKQTSRPRSASKVRHGLKVADEVWVATALLHREHPDRADFTVAEIVERARQEGLTPKLRPGVYPHANLHCVANRPPNPGRYLMLVETDRTAGVSIDRETPPMRPGGGPRRRPLARRSCPDTTRCSTGMRESTRRGAASS
jgi:hypothetical protein